MTRCRFLSWVLSLCLIGSALAAAADWETDFEKAKLKAERGGKFLLLDFSGSDWCGWCMKLDAEVFSKRDFKKYAKDNLILVLVDFPHGKKLPKKETARNEALREQYGIRGYPTVVLALPSGDEVARTGYLEGGPEKYVAHLQELLAPHREKLPKPAADSKADQSKRSSSSGKTGQDPAEGKARSTGAEGAGQGDGRRQSAVDRAL